MLSRVAESIYWMERYRERAENTARFIDVNLNLNMDMQQKKELQWDPIVRTTGDIDLFESRYDASNEKNVLEFLTFDKSNPNSILHCVGNARENARSVRQTIITEMWQEINTLYLFIHQAARDHKKIISPDQFYSRIKRQSQLILGIGEATMSHNEAWQFARLGALLERADKTSRILDVKYFILLPSVDYVGTAYDNILWAALLKSASGFEMYKKEWRRINPDHVLNFLIFDPHFPRSIFHCLKEAGRCLDAIHATAPDQPYPRPRRQLEILLESLKKKSLQSVIDYGIHEFLNDIQIQIMDLNDSIYKLYFSRFDFEQ